MNIGGDYIKLASSSENRIHINESINIKEKGNFEPKDGLWSHGKEMER